MRSGARPVRPRVPTSGYKRAASAVSSSVNPVPRIYQTRRQRIHPPTRSTPQNNRKMALSNRVLFLSAILLLAAVSAAAKIHRKSGASIGTARSEEEHVRFAALTKNPLLDTAVELEPTSRVSHGRSKELCTEKCNKWADWCLNKSGYHHFGDCIRCKVACTRADLKEHHPEFQFRTHRCGQEYSSISSASWTELSKTSRGSYDTCA